MRLPATTTKPATINEYKFTLPLVSEKEVALFLKVAFGITLPNKQICPNHTTPYRAFMDAYFAKSPVSVWQASRGFGGKSFLLAALTACEGATLKAEGRILGGSGEQSKRVHDYMTKFWQHRNAPTQILRSDPTAMETKFMWGNGIEALMASQKSVRGPHPTRLRLDECDEMSVDILDAALGQPMSTPDVPQQTVLSSTHQHIDGTMTEILRRAAQNQWPVYTWCYKETMQPHGWLSAADVETARKRVPAAMWNVEYELQEPTPESRAIEPSAVAAMFRSDLGIFDGYDGQYIEIEAPEDGALYSTGADWARSQDQTVIATIRYDCYPFRVIAFWRGNRRPWPVMVEQFERQMTRFPGIGRHDGTGIGDVVAGYLTMGADAEILIGRNRADLLSEYISAIERGEIESPAIRFMEAEHRYASVDDIYGSGHLPDSICAMALAYRSAGRAGRTLAERVQIFL
jgi:hypothetical protein